LVARFLLFCTKNLALNPHLIPIVINQAFLEKQLDAAESTKSLQIFIQS